MEASNIVHSRISKIQEQHFVNESLKEISCFQFASYIEKECLENYTEIEIDALIKFSLLVSSKIEQTQVVNFSKLFSEEFSTWEFFSQHFNKFLVMNSLPYNIVDEVSQLIQSVQVSKNLYCKLNSV